MELPPSFPPKSRPHSAATVTFPFNPPVLPPVPSPSKHLRRSKSIARPKPKRRSRHRSKQHRFDPPRHDPIKSTLQLLANLPLPAHYKTPHLLDALADPPCPDLPSAVEPVSLNAVTVQTTFMPSADVLPWHPEDDNPVPIAQNRECRV